jgi:hypothetical protein
MITSKKGKIWKRFEIVKRAFDFAYGVLLREDM